MVGRVGYAPTTPAMSMQYSTIELTALKKLIYKFFERIYLNFYLKHKKMDRFIIKIVIKNHQKKHLLVIME